MRKYLTKNYTTESNVFVGTAGVLTFNSETNKLMLHDGSTPGGNSVAVGPSDRIISPDGSKSMAIENSGTITAGGNIIPGSSTFNLGSLALPWKDVYVSKGSIVIADQDINTDAVYLSNTSGYIKLSRGGLKVTDNTGSFEVFQLDSSGKLLIKSAVPINTDSAAFEIIGSLLGESLPIYNTGVMLHSSGAINVPSRIYVDGVGTNATTGESAYAAFIGRHARGTVASPAAVQYDDIIVRFGGNGWGDTIGLQSISCVRMDMVATETHSSTGRGTEIQLWTTQVGTATPELSLHVDYTGIDFTAANSADAGITFKGGTRLTYFPSQTGKDGKYLKVMSGGTMSWEDVPVVSGTVIFKGTWDANGNTPSISDATGTSGWEWIVSTAGTRNLGHGSITFAVGDLVIHDGTEYKKITANSPAQIQSDWGQTTNTELDYIKNKPTLSAVATSGDYDDLSNKPYIPQAQVNADWDAVSGVSQILHKPTITNGTVTKVEGRGTVSGLTLTGNVTTSGNLVLGGSITGLTNSNLSGSAGITNANLANNTISGIALGGNLSNLIAGTNITFSSGTTYNGSSAITINAASNGVGGNQLVYVLNAVLSLASAKDTLASLFGLTSGVTVTSNTRYQYELVFNLQASKTGVLSYALALGGGAAVAQHNYSFEGNTTTTIVGYTVGVSLMSANATGAAITTAQTVADTLNGFAHFIVHGTIDVTTGGTVNFMISQNQNTPITWSVKPGAYVKLLPLGAIGANTAAGTWA